MSVQEIFMGHGRVARLSFFLTAIAIGVVMCIPLFATASVDPVTGQGAIHPIGWFSLFVGSWASVSLNARRCHDINKSGFYQLLGAIPIVGFIIQIQLLFEKGTPGTNSYGPAPGADMANEKAMEMRMERIQQKADETNGPAAEYYNDDGSFNMDGLFDKSGQ